jgi:signal peptidase I
MAHPRRQLRPGESRLKHEIRETFRSLVWAIVLFLLIRSFAFQAFRIPSPSMEDTLLIHDFLFISKLVYGPNIPFTHTRIPGIRKPKPGDVIVFQNPENPKEDYIKRCVAVGGQTVEVRNKVLYVDGVAKVEPYVKHTDPRIIPGRDIFGPVRVPEGHLFMMGDNRDNSQDSRYWSFLDLRLVRGKAEIIYFSWNGEKNLPRFPRFLRRIR